LCGTTPGRLDWVWDFWGGSSWCFCLFPLFLFRLGSQGRFLGTTPTLCWVGWEFRGGSSFFLNPCLFFRADLGFLGIGVVRRALVLAALLPWRVFLPSPVFSLKKKRPLTFRLFSPPPSFWGGSLVLCCLGPPNLFR